MSLRLGSREVRVLCVGLLIATGFASGVAAQTCSPVSTAPGSLDTCFGVNGYVQTDVTGSGAFQYASVVRVQPDGFIVIGGASRVAGSSGTELMLARYVPDGSSLDTSFGVGGIMKTRLTTSSSDTETLKDLVLQSDGKIVVAAQMPPSSKKGSEAFAVLRYNVDGTLDTSFGTSGIVSFSFANGTDAWLRTLAIQPDGKIVVAGESGTVLAVARLTVGGAFDTTFGTGGKATFASIVDRRQGPSIYAMALDNSSRPVLVGSLYALSLIVRLTTAGALDTTFASKGWMTVDYGHGGGTEYFTCLAFNGTYIVAGGRADTAVNRAPPLTDVALVRFTSAGAFDTNFGIGGKVVQDINGTFDVIHGLAIHNGGVIVSAEATATDYSTADTVVSRFTANGQLDTAFGTAGFTHTDFSGAYTYPYNLAVQDDGGVIKVVVVSNIGHSTSIGLTRYFW